MTRPIKDVVFNDNAKLPLIKGVNIVCDAVSATYGYNGRTVLIEDDGGFPKPTKDGVTVAKSIFLDDPIESLGAEYVKQAAQKTVDEAGDGPQPLYSKILTPDGWKTMGDMKKDMIICGTNGTFQRVVDVFPKGLKEIVKVKFSDNRIVECCENHLWQVKRLYRKSKVLSLKEIEDYNSEKYKFYVPKTFVDFKEQALELDPYLIGVLIGDGSLSGTGSIELSIGYKKRHILDKLILPKGIVFNVSDVQRKNYLRVKFTGCTSEGKYLKDYLKEIGLLGTLSSTKFIPKKYIYNSKENRQKLFDGLTDTDGYLTKKGLYEISTISEQLCIDIVELSRSLGMIMNHRLHIRKKDSSYSQTPIYRMNQLMGSVNGIQIKEIVRTGEFVEMQCIKVSNDDNLYITDNYIVTHNTSQSCVLTQAFVNASESLLKKGYTTNDVKKSLEKLKEDAIASIKKNSRKVTRNDYYNVASISANNDVFLGKIISDAFKAAGKNGVVTFERSGTKETYYEHINGMPIERGLHHKGYANQPDGSVIFERPLILVTDKTIKSIREITNLLEHVYTERLDLLIIGDVTDEVNNSLLANKIKNNLSIAVISPPSSVSKRTEYLKDIALVTGAMMLDTFSGDLTDGYGLSLLGTCRKFIIGKNDSILVKDSNFKKQEINAKIKELTTLLKDSTFKYEKAFLTDRISKLSCGGAIIKVGAITDAELNEKLDRVEDAIHAVRSAIMKGISAGGGVGYLNAYKEIPKDNYDGVLNDCLLAPIEKIDYTYNDELELNHGLNLATNITGDMFEMGIIDPTLVLICALENSISVATTILSTDVCITYKRA